MEKATLKRFSLLGVNAEHDFFKKNTFFPAPWKFPFRFYLHSVLETLQSTRHMYVHIQCAWVIVANGVHVQCTHVLFVCRLITAHRGTKKNSQGVEKRIFDKTRKWPLCFLSVASIFFFAFRRTLANFPSVLSSLPICYIWGWQIGKASDFPLLPPVVLLAFGGEKVPFQEMAVWPPSLRYEKKTNEGRGDIERSLFLANLDFKSSTLAYIWARQQ